jgi:4-diphosphocytidyl-2-C-methyl-D-erythritol kinase
MIRLLDRNFVHNGNDDELVRATHSLGADVGACIVSRTRIGTGLGWQLQMPYADDLQGSPVLLVNPRVPLPTGPVFAGWDGVDLGPMTVGTAREIAFAGRNDLEKSAVQLCPVIADVLAVLRDTQPLLARMSGSGATCFALYDTQEQRDAAADMLPAGWWKLAGRIR